MSCTSPRLPESPGWRPCSRRLPSRLIPQSRDEKGEWAESKRRAERRLARALPVFLERAPRRRLPRAPERRSPSSIHCGSRVLPPWVPIQFWHEGGTIAKHHRYVSATSQCFSSSRGRANCEESGCIPRRRDIGSHSLSASRRLPPYQRRRDGGLAARDNPPGYRPPLENDPCPTPASRATD